MSLRFQIGIYVLVLGLGLWFGDWMWGLCLRLWFGAWSLSLGFRFGFEFVVWVWGLVWGLAWTLNWVFRFVIEGLSLGFGFRLETGVLVCV